MCRILTDREIFDSAIQNRPTVNLYFLGKSDAHPYRLVRELTPTGAAVNARLSLSARCLYFSASFSLSTEGNSAHRLSHREEDTPQFGCASRLSASRPGRAKDIQSLPLNRRSENIRAPSNTPVAAPPGGQQCCCPGGHFALPGGGRRSSGGPEGCGSGPVGPGFGGLNAAFG